jgi:hypothetical protein
MMFMKECVEVFKFEEILLLDDLRINMRRPKRLYLGNEKVANPLDSLEPPVSRSHGNLLPESN